ncbi:MAG: DUF1178 family protein, partial [Alphaproteobacteria bacterium]|nr:DUF1178 family protein [Alphaproteobacteria bacterium]
MSCPRPSLPITVIEGSKPPAAIASPDWYRIGPPATPTCQITMDSPHLLHAGATSAKRLRISRFGMIKYTLRCSKNHKFDSWFRDSATYERQEKRRLLECPICGDSRIERALVAPNVAAKGNRKTGP